MCAFAVHQIKLMAFISHLFVSVFRVNIKSRNNWLKSLSYGTLCALIQSDTSNDTVRTEKWLWLLILLFLFFWFLDLVRGHRR